MYDETARATDTVTGMSNIKLLNSNGMLAGVKIDIGLRDLPGNKGETACVGLEDLAERAKEYYEMGIKFVKWRAVLKIDDATGCPSDASIMETAHSLARYASVCQWQGLVPIVEPEILMDGSHPIKKCYEVTDKVHQKVVEMLKVHGVTFEGMILKPNMVTKGFDHPSENIPEEVAYFTVKALSKNIPSQVPGVTFLSGG